MQIVLYLNSNGLCFMDADAMDGVGDDEDDRTDDGDGDGDDPRASESVSVRRNDAAVTAAAAVRLLLADVKLRPYFDAQMHICGGHWHMPARYPPNSLAFADAVANDDDDADGISCI